MTEHSALMSLANFSRALASRSTILNNMTVFIFPDTNAFLQCRDFAELRWADITSEENIRILVSRTVQREIDRLKTDGNKRRSSRARKTSTFFRTIIRASDETLVIRDSKPRVTVGFPEGDSAKQLPMQDELDRDYEDDRLVAEALAFHDTKGVEVCLLSNDTHVVLTAKRVGLKYEEIPDSWILPPEPDPREKEIVDLRGRVEKLEDRLPEYPFRFSTRLKARRSIVLKFRGASTRPLQSIDSTRL